MRTERQMENRTRKEKRKQETKTTLETGIEAERHKKQKVVDRGEPTEENQGKRETKRRSIETGRHQKYVRRAKEQQKLTERKEREIEKSREEGIGYWRDTFLKMVEKDRERRGGV